MRTCKLTARGCTNCWSPPNAQAAIKQVEIAFVWFTFQFSITASTPRWKLNQFFISFNIYNNKTLLLTSSMTIKNNLFSYLKTKSLFKRIIMLLWLQKWCRWHTAIKYSRASPWTNAFVIVIESRRVEDNGKLHRIVGEFERQQNNRDLLDRPGLVSRMVSVCGEHVLQEQIDRGRLLRTQTPLNSSERMRKIACAMCKVRKSKTNQNAMTPTLS